jgi:hypothetical protein
LNCIKFRPFKRRLPDDDKLAMMVMVVAMLVVLLVSFVNLDRPGFRFRHGHKKAQRERQQ